MHEAPVPDLDSRFGRIGCVHEQRQQIQLFHSNNDDAGQRYSAARRTIAATTVFFTSTHAVAVIDYVA